MQFTVREGREVDVHLLAALLAAAGMGRRRDPEHLAAMLEGSRWVVSAWDGEQLVGFARAISDGVSNAYVSHVAVAPSHQRHGVGSKLLEVMVAGKPTVKWVLHTSVAGERLYRGLGFVDATRMLVRDRTE